MTTKQYEKFKNWHKEEYGYSPDDSEIDSEQRKRVANREHGFRAGWLAHDRQFKDEKRVQKLHTKGKA